MPLILSGNTGTSTLDSSNGLTFSDASLQGAAASPYVLKNRIINGAMEIDQRNAGASVTVTDAYTLDRWEVREDTDGAVTTQQVADAPSGFVYSAKITTTTADATLTSTQRLFFRQPIEGLNVADLAWGTASAKTVTLSFWVKSSLTGTFGGSLTNNGSARSYPFTYTINLANTWEQKTITVAGDTTGTWLTSNLVGLNVFFGLGVGSDYSGTAGAWVTATRFSTTGAVSVIGTLSATWQVTGVQLEIGTTATPFERRLYNQELANCQRYFWTTRGSNPLLVNNLVGNTVRFSLPLNPVSMRTTATITYYTAASAAGSLTEFSAATSRVVSSTNNLQAIGGGWFQTSTAVANPIELRAEFSAEL